MRANHKNSSTKSPQRKIGILRRERSSRSLCWLMMTISRKRPSSRRTRKRRRRWRAIRKLTSSSVGTKSPRKVPSLRKNRCRCLWWACCRPDQNKKKERTALSNKWQILTLRRTPTISMRRSWIVRFWWLTRITMLAKIRETLLLKLANWAWPNKKTTKESATKNIQGWIITSMKQIKNSRSRKNRRNPRTTTDRPSNQLHTIFLRVKINPEKDPNQLRRKKRKCNQIMDP